MRHLRRTLGLVLCGLALGCSAGQPTSSGHPAVPSPATSAMAGGTLIVPSAAVATPSGPYNGVAIVRIDAQVFDAGGADVGYLGISASSVWAATIDGLVRIDPKTRVVQQIDHGAHFGIAVTANAVWTSDPDAGIVARFDPVSGTQTAHLEMIGYPESMAILDDSVWVAQHWRGSVTRIGEPSGTVIAQVEVGPAGRGGPHGVTATEDAVWVGVTNSKSVVRIDPATNGVVATIPTTASPCGGIAVQPRAVWISSCFDDQFVVRIDPSTNRNVAEIDVGGNNGGAMIVDDYPWFPVANHLVRIDPATNRVDRIVEFTNEPFEGYGSAVGFNAAWIGGFNGFVARVPIDALKD